MIDAITRSVVGEEYLGIIQYMGEVTRKRI